MAYRAVVPIHLAIPSALSAWRFFFSAKLWKTKITTLGDLFHTRYHPQVERFAALLMIPTSLLWAAAQVRSFGQILASSSGGSIEMGMSLAALVVIIYTLLGGLLADVITDVFQGIFIIIGLLCMLYISVDHLGGIEISIGKLSAGSGSLLGFGDRNIFEVMDAWAVPILGSLVAQELISRVISARSASVATWSCLFAAAMYLFVGIIPVLVGLLGVHVMPEIADPEQLLAAVAQKLLSPFAYVLFMGALVSAILSTVDNTLLAISALVVKNVLRSGQQMTSGSQRLFSARLWVAGAGVIAYCIALSSGGIYELIEQASSFGSAGILVLMVMGLYSTRGGRLAGLWTLSVGAAAVPVLEYFNYPAPYLGAIFSALLIFISVSLYENRKVLNVLAAH